MGTIHLQFLLISAFSVKYILAINILHNTSILISVDQSDQLHISFLNASIILPMFPAAFSQVQHTFKADDGDTWITCFEYICSGMFSMDGTNYYDLTNDGIKHSVYFSHSHYSINSENRKKRTSEEFTEHLIIEYIAVVDTSIMNSYSHNKTRVLKHVLDVSALASEMLYNKFKISLLLVDIIYLETNQFKISHSANLLLGNFQTWVKSANINKRFDLIHFYTETDFDGNTVGLAVVSGMCRRSSSTAVIQMHSQNTVKVAMTVAHEIGHSLGLSHDNQFDECKNTNCIMSATLSSLTTKICWSSCSVNSLKLYLDNGGGTCLYDIPTQLVGPPICGNSILEQGEECDCGPSCADKCCNSSTCMLTSSAMCSANDLCCNTDSCMYSKKGAICRVPHSECDLEEVCTGISSDCPANTYKQSGTFCNDDKSMCHDGQCVIPDVQCKEVRGDNYVQSPNCYSLNRNGDELSNCGTVDGEYIKCAAADEKCGSLYCSENSSLNNGRCQVSRNDNNEVILVNEGTKCASGNYCISQKCVNVQSTSFFAACPNNCSNQGQCNNLNKCQCDAGWTGPDCAGDSISNSFDFWIICLILAILLLVSFLLLCAIAFFFRRRFSNIENSKNKSIKKTEIKPQIPQKTTPKSYPFTISDSKSISVVTPPQSVSLKALPTTRN